MDQISPLVQQQRPDILTPKIVGLYDTLFSDEQQHEEQAEGFWTELFLLKPDLQHLSRKLSTIPPTHLLHHHSETCQQVFHRGIQHVQSGAGPADEYALDTLTVLLESVLGKKYPYQSTDIITILAGLEDVDKVFTDFVTTLDASIRDGRTLDVRQKAVRAGISAVSGSYQTGLVSYFINRDLFPSLMKFIQDAEEASRTFEAFALLGLLSNYNKFEFQNPYRLRFEDFVNDKAIYKVVNSAGSAFIICRDAYVSIQEDKASSWKLGDTMQLIGISSLFSRNANGLAVAEDDTRPELLALYVPLVLRYDLAKANVIMSRPPLLAVVILSTYDFAFANKLFGYTFAILPVEKDDLQKGTSFSNFLSLTSYMIQNAHRTERGSLYLSLSLLTIQIVIEDAAVARALATMETSGTVKLCRQRPPYLPQQKPNCIVMCLLLDTVIDGISHNMRKRLDKNLYQLLLRILVRIISFLSFARIKLAYHWSMLWRHLLSFMRFLNTYSVQLTSIDGIEDVVETLAHILAFVLSAGESFLPNASSHDDLFYKVLESGDQIPKLRDNYKLASRSQASSSIDILLSVHDHCKGLVEKQRGNKSVKSLSSQEVARIINAGFDSLNLESRDKLSNWERFREVDHKSLLKRVVKFAALDMRSLVAQQTLDKKDASHTA